MSGKLDGLIGRGGDHEASIKYSLQVRYEVIENPGTFLEVCTTRPETIVGDVALAMHPEDERWKALEGKHVRRPINPIAIPIIADQAVDRDFRTRVLKITPRMTNWTLRLLSVTIFQWSKF